MQTEPISSPPAASADPQALYAAFHALRRDRKLRHRDAARALGVSECEAVAAAVGQRGPMSCVRLAGPWPALFEQMPRLGRVLALTRNDTTVHEKTGRFENMSHEGQMGLALGRDIDLRIFYSRWAHGYAVSEEIARGVRRSLQFFDAHGVAVHKVFLRDGSDVAAFSDLVERHASFDQRPGERVQPGAAPAEPVADDEIDVAAFHAAWQALADTHEFFPLLRRFGLARQQALRLAPPDFAYRVPTDAARRLLQQAARGGVSIMCFVGNPGVIQIHTGCVQRVEVMGQWLNVLDPGFNLHLREDAIAAAWVVKKPTRDGHVTSLELFDAAGGTMAMFFGERKPGSAERADWRALVELLPHRDG
ncbi:hemin-degrading factor [Betaproteobacteria bacterium PRO7]|nr:hemin-degrading factor [Betaproteobacteria bacterium PRO7]